MTGAGEAPEPVRVLLADDQRLVRESLATLLGLLDGIELVASAADGEEAVALVGEYRPDVVLMDLRMPRMDGIEAIRTLRERRPEVGVIALTTFADDENVLGALRAGARGYLTKDAGGEDILAAILTVAAGEAALDPAVQHHVVAALNAGGGHGERVRAGNSGADPAPAFGGGSDPAAAFGGGSDPAAAFGGGSDPAAAFGGGSDPAAAFGGGSDPAAAALPDDLTPREAEVLTLIAAGLSNAEIAERLVVSPTTVKSHINHLFAKAGLRDRAQAVNYAYRTGIAAPPR